MSRPHAALPDRARAGERSIPAVLSDDTAGSSDGTAVLSDDVAVLSEDMAVLSDDAGEVPEASGPVAGQRQPLWMARYRIALVTLDLCAIIVATVSAYVLRFANDDTDAPNSTVYLGIGLAIALGWVVTLQYCGGYELRHLASGPVEAKRVLRASAMTVGILAVVSFALRFPLARGFVLGVIPLGAILLLLERTAVRRVVATHRARGEWVQRILAVGTSESVASLVEVIERARGAGLHVVGACAEDTPLQHEIASGIRVLGGVFDAAQVAEKIGADVIAVTGSGLGPRGVRELGWQLEGTGRGLVMAPALTEIAGTRVHVSPVEGLPLVWLDQPQLGRLPRLVKRLADVVGGLLLLVVATPLLLVCAAAIKATSRGPVFFRQRRLGVNGAEFWIRKFRTMHVGSEERRAEIMQLNDQDGAGVLFKIRSDPRITPVGRFLRAFSIDELPQLLHVVAGTMSLVGPRPLAAEDSTYTGSARRRLLVRPGLTGLWQISGRSDMTWDDAVRLDLYYVENWSLGLDISILVRTVFAVLGRKGAY